jgi:uncharacterized membrane protein YobD (UPF0266 family)
MDGTALKLPVAVKTVQLLQKGRTNALIFRKLRILKIMNRVINIGACWRMCRFSGRG